MSLAQMLALAHASLPRAISTLWLAGLHAIFAWLLIGPPAILLLYFVISRALRQLAASRLRSNTTEVA
jgi:hypothetical protein